MEKSENFASIKVLGCVVVRGSSSLLIGFGCTLMAISALPVGAQAVREGTFVAPAAQDNKVDVYTLPERMQTVLVGDSGSLYAVGYYITTNDNAGGPPYGISLEQWVTDENLSKFFSVWLDDPLLAKQLSEGYKVFANEQGLLGGDCSNVVGDTSALALCLNGGNNGGGFIYSGWSSENGEVQNIGENRPVTKGGSKGSGINYYWNGEPYFTYSGGREYSNRIQAFGGCEVNTIDMRVPTNALIQNGASDLCSYDGNQVSSTEYAPVFQGGVLVASGEAVELDQNFYVASSGGTIDNAGFNLAFSGNFSDHLPDATFGKLLFTGSGVTSLSGENDFDGEVVVDAGVLDVADVQGLGSALGSTTVRSDALLRLSFSGLPPLAEEKQEAKFLEPVVLAGGELEITGNYLDLKGGLVLKQDSIIDVPLEGSQDVFIRSVVSGEGGLIKQGLGYLRLGSFSPQAYRGGTTVRQGELRIAETTRLPATTDVLIDAGARLRLMGPNNEIRSIRGAGDLILQNDSSVLRVNQTAAMSEFSGAISGRGGLTKLGSGTLILSGLNTYQGATTISDGLVVAAEPGAIPTESKTRVEGRGQLNLREISSDRFELNRLDVVDGGVVYVSRKHPLVSSEITLAANSSSTSSLDGAGGFVTRLDFDDQSQAAIQIQPGGSFDFQSGSLLIQAEEDVAEPLGTWSIISGDVANVEQLAENTFLAVGDDSGAVSFNGLGPQSLTPISTLYEGYLEEGSLDLVVEVKSKGRIDCDLFPDQPQCDQDNPVNPPVPNPIEPDPEPKPIDPELKPINTDPQPLPGCDDGDDLCDNISDLPGQNDDATDQDEAISSDVIAALFDGLRRTGIALPLGFDYGDLARLVGSGLLPRNVDAPGRSLFNYNNLLVDTVFERLPLRQFQPVEVSAVVDEEAVMEEPAPVAEPVRGLWSQQPGMQDEQAQAFVGQQLAQAEELVETSIAMEIDGVGYVEDPSLTAQYANRDGVRAWYRAFGGDLGPTTTSTLYGDYNASASGMVLGADVSIGSNVQIGAFANYGDVSLYQLSGETGSGAWSPSGWGGGITADWWSDNFYVQGLISASSFSGTQSRNIIAINEQLGDDTARGEKNVTSYAYALRLGAPFQSGSLLLEPQFTAAWTQNQESGFRENGADQLNLRYGSRTTNFLQTELGMKLALPIKSGERGEWVPNLRVAWLGDWDMNNEDQSIGYSFTDKTVGVAPLEDDQNGVLIEAGLDYTMANINSGSWKLFVRGGAEVWGGEGGTDWRASGGMTWQF